jgi:Uma2 family endonuclease
MTAQAQPVQERRLKMSYDEYLAWEDEGAHGEWVNGEVIVFMPPTLLHQRLSGLLGTLLSTYARHLNLGLVLAAPVEMQLFPGRSSREPDLLFVAREHLDRLTPERLVGPADLVVEIVSDSSVGRDRGDKFYEYQEAGVPEYLIIDPRPGKQRVDFFRLTAEGTYLAILPDAAGRYHSLVLPGFWFDPEWLWQDPLPNALTVLGMIAPEALRGALTSTEQER